MSWVSIPDGDVSAAVVRRPQALCDTRRMPEDTTYGFLREDWDRAKRQARDFLVACARERGTTTYGGLCVAVDAIPLRPYSFAMVAFLDQICREDDARHGIILASLVTRRDTGMPGEGYFQSAVRAGCDISDRAAFWREQADRIYDIWADEGEL
jgi:hypothetical protein